MILNRILAAVAMLLVLAACQTASASSTGHSPTRYAMLVGVTKYPSLAENYQLHGPVNDVQIAKRMLEQKGFARENILVYAETQGAKEPTRANIMAGLADIANRAHRGDFVYLQFGGHGSREPAPADSDEADGLDEIFLPKDIGSWDDDIGAVKNAIIDDNVRDAVQRIRAKGAFVWAVFDSCHSGTMTRGGGLRMREVSSSALGISDEQMTAAASRAVHARGRGGDKEQTMLRGKPGEVAGELGGMVAFYAAQSTETTPEMLMPRGGEGKKTAYGLFTYSLVEALGSSSHISYRQLSEQILQSYAAKGWDGSTPLFEGDLDQGVFGEKVGEPVRQWELGKSDDGKLTIQAGRMHMLNKGAILAVMPKAASEKKDALGYVEVTEAGDFSSVLASVGKDVKLPRFDMSKLKPGQFARLVDPNIRYELRIFASKTGNPVRALDSAVQRLMRDGINQVNVTWADKPELADLQIVSDNNNRVYLLSQGEVAGDPGAISREFGMVEGTRDAGLEEWLENSVAAIAKVKNLMMLSSNMGSSYPDLKTAVQVNPESAGEVKLDGSSVPTLKNGDTVWFSVENNARDAMDITVLFLDRNYGLYPVFPQKGQSNRIESMGKEKFKLGKVNDKTVGREGLIVIAVPAKTTAARSDFSFLAQKGVEVASRGYGQSSSTRSLFETAGFNMPHTRGFETGDDGAAFQMRVFRWTTVH